MRHDPVASNIVVVVALLAVGIGTARATQPDKERALRLYREGTALFDNGDYAAALAAFEASRDLFEHKNTLYALGEVCRRLGRLRESHAYYSRYARYLPPDEREQFAKKLERLRTEAAGELRLHTEPAGAAVSVDGQASGETPLRVNLDGGTHEVKLTRVGHRSLTRTVRIEFGEPVELTLRLQPVAEAKPDQRPPRHLGGLFVEASAGVAVVGFGADHLDAGAGLGVTLTGGHLWHFGEIAVGAHFAARYTAINDDVVDRRSGLVALVGGGGFQWHPAARLWLGARVGVGLSLLVGVAPESFLLRDSSTEESQTVAGLALCSSAAAGWTFWKGLSLLLTPASVCHSPRVGGFADLSDDIGGITHFQAELGLAWQR